MRILNITFLLSPVGLIVVGITALVAVFVILYKTVEPVRNLLNNLWEGFLKLLGPIGDVVKIVGGKAAEAFKNVTKTIGLTSDQTKEATSDMDKFGNAGVAAANKTSTAFSRMYDSLKAQFKPGGADETEAFLKSIGADPTLVNDALDALYDTVGGSEKTRFEKLTDEGYAQLVDKAKTRILGPIQDTLKKYADMSEEEFANVAKAAGKSSAEVMAEAKRQEVDAEARLKLFSDKMAAAIDKARHSAQGFTALVDPHVVAVHNLRDAWEEAHQKVTRYGDAIRNLPSESVTHVKFVRGSGGDSDAGSAGPTNNGGDPDPYAGLPFTGYATGGFVKRTELALVHAGEYVVPRKDVGALGGTTVIAPAITLNYTGNGESDQSVAASMASSVVDQVTEILRQQGRRVGNRLSPFGAS